MKFFILHKCPNGDFGPDVQRAKVMTDITRNPEVLDRNVERPFRVFRCDGCGLEIKIERLGQ